jgi:hypothetical protein
LSFRHSEPPNQGLHKSLPFGHHSEPAGRPLLEMTGSGRKIPVVHYRQLISLTQLPSGPSLVPGKNGSRIQGSSTATGNCGSTSDHYRGESNATKTIRWIWRCSMSAQDSRAQHSGRDLIRAEIDVPPTPPDPNKPLPIPKAPPTPTDEPPPEPVQDPPAESEPKPPYTVEERTR